MPSLSLSATHRKPRDAPCCAPQLLGPTVPRSQGLNGHRRGQRVIVTTPLRGRSARVGGSRDLLASAQSPQMARPTQKILSVPLLLDEIHCRMCSATVYEISRLRADFSHFFPLGSG